MPLTTWRWATCTAPQKVGRNTLRYCGTPLKYSFSEASQHKSVTFVELGEKGSVTIAAEPLVPRHDLRELRGSYMELPTAAITRHRPWTITCTSL